MICTFCGCEITGAPVPGAYQPECGPPAPMHYACRLREIDLRARAELSARLRLERAAPALLEACRLGLAVIAELMEWQATVQELLPDGLCERAHLVMAKAEDAVALAQPQEKENADGPQEED